ncbi:MAG: alpha/beta fold hydrolase [Acidimicrobiales bacterium]
MSTNTETGAIVGPHAADGGPRPRLARHQISLADGHEVGVAVCGRGVPIVLIHGFTAEGMLYAQTLNRIVAAGFKVVAIDVASHGSTQGLPTGGANFEEYAKLLGRVVDELGIKKAVFAGHSMGGRLITELAAREPDRALAVILLDAIVGETWDRLVAVSRFNPLLLAGVGAVLLVDSVSTVPFLRDPKQAFKFGRLLAPTLVSHVRNPLHLAGPGVSILRSRSSRWMLEKLGKAGVPVVAIHGDRDIVVPLSTARSSAARLSGGMVVVVEGSAHSWLLKDPGRFARHPHQLFEHRPTSRAATATSPRHRPGARRHHRRDRGRVLRPRRRHPAPDPAHRPRVAAAMGVRPEPLYRWHVDHPA